MIEESAQDASAQVLPLQQASAVIAADKRLLPGEDLDGMRRRLANALARPEKDPAQWADKFYWMLQYAFPAGRISANLGAEAFKPKVSSINCTVSRTIDDSMDKILLAAHAAGLTLKAGCGIGYDFTTIRPNGAWVNGAGSYTSGVLPFMEIFDAICKTVSSAGGRRGAQMGVLEICHPDVLDFIKAKRKDGYLRQFNLSVLITDAFIDAVRNKQDWQLVFPAFKHEMETESIVWRRWPRTDKYYTYNEKGETACRVYRTIPATDIWDLIMKSTFEFSDPGFILIDEYNRMNPLWFAENIRATNPCGEQGLPPDGACLLGSVNLAMFVRKMFTKFAEFDWKLFREVVRVFSRALDNVVEMNGLPLERQREEIFRKRRHGMGYLGLGSALTMMGIKYGSKEAIEFTEKVSMILAHESWKAALELSMEKGPAPIMTELFELTEELMERQPQLREDGYKVGDLVTGSVLHAKYSRYMQKIASIDPLLVEQLAIHGARYSHATSIAPTGTMAAGEGNNASNGIEPSFMHGYVRNMIVPGKKTKQDLMMMSYEMLAYRQFVDPEADPQNPPAYFDGTTSEVDAEGHVDIQAAAQKWIDSSISKTINVRTNITFEEFKDIYWRGIDSDLKGCTTFRFNPAVHGGVLVKSSDLAETIYTFKLADGTEVKAKGSDTITYDGEKHSAQNLFDALKENRYGRY